MDDEPEVTTSEPPPAVESAAPAPSTVEYARLRESALVLSGRPQWVVDGAAAANGWGADTRLTREGFNDAIEAWLTRPVKSVGSTDTTS